MRSGKKVGFVYYCLAIALYACAFLNLFNAETRTYGIMWLCLGSSFLCLGSSMRRMDKKDPDDKDDQDTEK